MYDIALLPAAQADLEGGFWFYEAQAVGLGGFHRTLSKRFPFAIYDDFDGRTATVVAVLDCRRNPAVTRERPGR